MSRTPTRRPPRRAAVGTLLVLLLAACSGRATSSSDTTTRSTPDSGDTAEAPAAPGPNATTTPPAAAITPAGADTTETPAADGLRLELRARKTQYAAGEALELTAWLINDGASSLVVLNRASHVDLGIDAANEADEFLTSLLPPEPPEPPTAADLATLQPGGELELADWELLSRVNQQIRAGNGRSGRFTVTARYHAGSGLTENLRKLDPSAWVGSLTSNAVVLEVP